MIRRILLAVMTTVALVAAPAVYGATGADPRTMTFPQLNFRIPASERFVLPNGMIVHLMEDRELPLVNITAYVRTGSIYEPAEKTGLAALTGAVMRSGGVAGIEPAKVDDELELMASSVESSIGAEVGTVSLASLTRNLDRTLEIFAGVLRSPTFREDRLRQALNRTLEALRRQNDDPKEVAERELRKALYPGHPLGRVPSVKTVNRITRDDLLAFHRTYYAPNSIILAVSGDIGRKELEEKLTRFFGDWKRQEVALPAVPQPVFPKDGRIYQVTRDLSQSVIRMGHEGIEKNNPDLYALRVLDYILGSGGFNSRLMSEIRSRQGLAYNVESYFDVGRGFPGLFLADTETKAASTAKAIRAMLDIIRSMTTEKVSDQELRLAKEAMINSFIFGFTKTDAVVNQRARIEYYGYPEGYLENYRENLSRVTGDDLLRVAQKYLHPDRMTMVVVGKESAFDAPLSTFGPVSRLRLDNGATKADTTE